MATQRSIRAGGLGSASRRDVLRLFGAACAGAVVAGCDGNGGSPSGGSSPGGVPSGLPTGDVKLRWMSYPDAAPFFEPWFERYQGEHPNITVAFDAVPLAENKDVVSLGVQNGNAHDVFVTPTGVPAVTMVREGWVAPLDEWIPNVEEWKSRYLPTALSLSIYDGKLYNCPLNMATGVQNLLFYNRAMLNNAGYDPQAEPLSWDDLRDAARKITQAGNGDYHGFVIAGGQANRLASWVDDLATYAGSGTTRYHGSSFDWSSGEFTLTTDEHLGAVELLMAMIDDGSALPGFAGMNQPQASAAVPQGSAAMMLWVPNVASGWPRGQLGGIPDFDFGVAQPPAPDPSDLVPNGAGPGAALMFWAYADSPNLAVVGDMFSWLGSPEGVAEYFQTIGIANKPAFDGVAELVDWTEVERQTIDIVDQIHVTRPDPAVRNPDVETAWLQWRPPEPNLGVVMQGVLAGELDARQGLQQLQDALNQALDDVVSAAEGLEVSRDDWVFPNWNPTEDYLPEDYAEL